MQLDIPSLKYSDALIYINDFMSETPVFGISEDDFYALVSNYNIETNVQLTF